MASATGEVPHKVALVKVREGTPVHFAHAFEPLLVHNHVDPMGTLRSTAFDSAEDGLPAFEEVLNKWLDNAKFNALAKKNGTYTLQVRPKLRQ